MNLKDLILRERNVLAVPKGAEDNERLAATALKNLESIGFTLDKEGYENLKTASKDEIVDWYTKAYKDLKDLVGGNREYHPLFPNFPDEVINGDEFELFVKQMLHYWVGYKPEENSELEGVQSLEEHPLKVVRTIVDAKESVEGEALAIFTNLLRTKENLTPAQMESVVKTITDNIEDWTDYTGVIENRVNLCTLLSIALEQKKDTSKFPKMVTNDYLRLAYIKESGSTEPCKVKSLPRSMRKFIAKGLEGQKNLEEDVARNEKEWKSLFKVMHVGEFQKCKRLQDVVNKVRNNIPLRTYYGSVEKAYMTKDIDEILRLYKQRPGEFVKALNRVLIFAQNQEDYKEALTKVVNAWKETAPKVRTEDLIRVVGLLRNRSRDDNNMRVHNVKGQLFNSGKILPPMNKQMSEFLQTIAINVMKEQLVDGDSLGKVYIDDSLSKCAVPLNKAGRNESMQGYTPGSRISIERNENDEPKNIRNFVWWTNGIENDEERRIDIDLHATLYKFNEQGILEKVADVGYGGYYDRDGVVYSGDITDGGDCTGKGVTEFIDVNLSKLKESGIDYVSVSLHDYTGYAYSEHINCECGWMEREELDKTQHFDIAAVKNHSRINGQASFHTSNLIDVNSGEIVWVDHDNRTIKAADGVAHMDLASIMYERYGKYDGMTLYEIAEINAQARGEIVSNIEDADTVFTLDITPEENESLEGKRVITCKDQDIWLGEFMTPQHEEPVEPENEELTEEISEEKIASEKDDVITQLAQELSDAYLEDVSEEDIYNDVIANEEKEAEIDTIMQDCEEL